MSTDALAGGWAKALGGDRKQFDMFFDKMIDGFAYHKIVVDKSGKPVDYVFLEVNRTFEEMTGLKREKIIGKKVTEFLPGIEKDPADWIGIYGKVALTAEPTQFENYAAPLGKWYKVVAYCPEKNHFVSLFEDITERKKNEETLRRINEELEERVRKQTEEVSNERQRLYNILESLPAYVVLLDKDYHVPFANKVFRERFGESFGRRCYEYLFNLNAPCENCESYKVLKTMGPNHWEWTGPDKRNYDIYDYPFPEANGSTLILEMGIDITERKKAEALVFAERKRLFEVLETLPLMVCLLTPDYHVAFTNRSFREKFGESNGRRCYEYCFGKQEPCEFCESYTVLKTGQPHRWEVTGPDGSTIEAYDFPFTDVDGSKLILEMDIDVSPRKRAEAAALEAAKKLKDSERLAAIGATAGMVGHDIRNPLQAITGDVFLAKSELSSIPESDEKKNVLENLEEIEKNTDYINKIVQDLQDYARPLNPQAENTELKIIIKKLLAKNGLPHDVKVNVEVEDEAAKFEADSYYINRIMYNLVTNSVQAMPKGGKLTIRAYKEADIVVIAVKDTGIGIPKEAQGKIFTPMFTTKSKGQGFGLPVVKRMTDALGGTVTFESQEGRGTTFTVCLPAQREKHL